MLSPSYKFSGFLESTVYPAKNIGGTIYPKIPLNVTIKFNIVINLVLSLVGNHSIETEA